MQLVQAFLDLGEILISSDTGAALEAYRTVRASTIRYRVLPFVPVSLSVIPFIVFTIHNFMLLHRRAFF